MYEWHGVESAIPLQSHPRMASFQFFIDVFIISFTFSSPCKGNLDYFTNSCLIWLFFCHSILNLSKLYSVGHSSVLQVIIINCFYISCPMYTREWAGLHNSDPCILSMHCIIYLLHTPEVHLLALPWGICTLWNLWLTFMLICASCWPFLVIRNIWLWVHGDVMQMQWRTLCQTNITPRQMHYTWGRAWASWMCCGRVHKM